MHLQFYGMSLRLHPLLLQHLISLTSCEADLSFSSHAFCTCQAIHPHLGEPLPIMDVKNGEIKPRHEADFVWNPSFWLFRNRVAKFRMFCNGTPLALNDWIGFTWHQILHLACLWLCKHCETSLFWNMRLCIWSVLFIYCFYYYYFSLSKKSSSSISDNSTGSLILSLSFSPCLQCILGRIVEQAPG